MDPFDELARAWFAKLPSLASEQYARRYLATFLRQSVREAVLAERARIEAILQATLVGTTCEHTPELPGANPKLCGKPSAGAYLIAWGACEKHLTPLCASCAEIPGAFRGGKWIGLHELLDDEGSLPAARQSATSPSDLVGPEER